MNWFFVSCKLFSFIVITTFQQSCSDKTFFCYQLTEEFITVKQHISPVSEVGSPLGSLGFPEIHENMLKPPWDARVKTSGS